MRSMIVLASLALATPALAGYDSAYTNLNFEDSKACTNETPPPVEGEPNDGVVYTCGGYQDYAVMFAEGDLRSFVSFGKEQGEHCAARQTFSGFNSVGNKIEWRLKDGRPIATILRWSVSYDPDDSSKQKSWLVVTKLDEGNSCHVGYVEGGYPKANEKARWLADTAAEAFSCKDGKTIFFANPGTDTDGIASDGGCAE
jgi:hypothetical protein